MSAPRDDIAAWGDKTMLAAPVNIKLPPDSARGRMAYLTKREARRLLKVLAKALDGQR